MECTSVYSRELCRVLAAKLRENRWDHSFMLAGSFLNPLFREMEFIADARLRLEKRSKAESFAPKLIRKLKDKSTLISSEIKEENADEMAP